MTKSGKTAPCGATDKEAKMNIAIGATVITPVGEAVVIEQLPHSAAVRVQFIDKRLQRKCAGKGDVWYPSDLTVKVAA